MAKMRQREDSWWGGVGGEEKAIREESPKAVLTNAGNQQEILAVVAEAGLLSVTGAGHGLAAEGFSPCAGGSVSLC